MPSSTVYNVILSCTHPDLTDYAAKLVSDIKVQAQETNIKLLTRWYTVEIHLLRLHYGYI